MCACVYVSMHICCGALIAPWVGAITITVQLSNWPLYRLGAGRYTTCDEVEQVLPPKEVSLNWVMELDCITMDSSEEHP